MATSQFDDLAAPITSANADLKAEIVDGVDTLGRAIGISEPKRATNPAALLQIDLTVITNSFEAGGAVVEAAASLRPTADSLPWLRLRDDGAPGELAAAVYNLAWRLC